MNPYQAKNQSKVDLILEKPNSLLTHLVKHMVQFWSKISTNISKSIFSFFYFSFATFSFLKTFFIRKWSKDKKNRNKRKKRRLEKVILLNATSDEKLRKLTQNKLAKIKNMHFWTTHHEVCNGFKTKKMASRLWEIHIEMVFRRSQEKNVIVKS